jgi:flagellar biosynthetic protein FliP
MAHAVASSARPVSLTRATWNFGRHLFEMCAAMCIGVAVLDVPFLAVARATGVDDPIRDLPDVAALVVAFNMSLPMVLWMRHRGHDWTCIWEMTGAMFLEAGVLIAAHWAGVVSGSTVVAWQHALMVPVMIAVMLFRLDLYTGRADHAAEAS